ncbi:nitronate monooxygenase [Sphingomonas kyeonggiensis]|uniref:NAD(P)H-dependent flavin oxidoreductase n=1 Tax=Sphingomonas kyeonggiensis TaxID=1268553 RepID=UPI0027851D21|nr:nitronate monooxygenase [Sphingomonas kyeonggiensis]MDQ0251543.1 nitronate monooxygenase [Sphingomonas kyeonggiensis]
MVGFLEALGASAPIVQAPMAGAGGPKLAIAAIRGGAVGSLPCAMLTPEQLAGQVAEVRAAVRGPLNLNFFCHHLPEPTPDESAWRALLAPYYAEEGVQPGPPPPLRRPFDAALCEAVERVRPEIVSFHFGLPEESLLARVRGTGALVFGNATTAEEMHWLARRGVDAVIAQGAEAGGHSGWFLGDRHNPTQLAKLLAEKIPVPVIAAGGIIDGPDIARALSAGASAVQLGTAFLATPESSISAPFRALLGTEVATRFTNLFSGREAQGIENRLMRDLGAIRDEVPAFPYGSNALAPLRTHAEADGRGDYSPLWAGTGVARVRPTGAEALVRQLAGALASKRA